MVGKDRFKDINSVLNKRLEEKKVLVVAHRGSWGGNIVNNTIPAYLTALKQGADIFECDLIESTDGVLYTFHDGTEPWNFGINENIKRFSSEEIDTFIIRNSDMQFSDYHVEKFEDVLKFFCHGELFNIDRAESILPSVAKVLEKYPDSIKQAIIKTSPSEKNLEFFENYPMKFMYIPIVKTVEEAKKVLSYQNINLVGMELLAKTQDDEWFKEENLKWLKEQGIFCWLNSIRLGGPKKWDLYGGLDDDRAIMGDPEDVWGVMIDKGAEVIQTDWPAILSSFRDNRK